MKIRNGETPIKIPPIVKAGDPITARWANDLRDALQRLRDRVPVIKGASGGGGGFNLPFQIYIGSEIPEGETESQIFIGAYPGTLEVEVFDDVKEYSPTTGTWYLQARIEIDPDTGETIDKAVEFVTTMGTNTGVLFHLQIGSIQVDASGTPQNNTISQTNYGPIQVVKYGGIVQKWNVVLY
jgi:hypothetical protein